MGRVPFESFLATFSQVKSRFGQDPDKLWLAKNDLKLGVLLSSLYKAARDVEAALAVSESKYVTDVPDSFQNAFDDYRAGWAQKVDQVVFEWFVDNCDLIIKKLGISLDIRDLSIDSQRDFDPIEDDPAASVGDLLLTAEDIASADPDDWHGRAARKGLQALGFFERTMGLDLRQVARRWKRITPIYLPKHVSAGTSPEGAGYLYRLLDEATRAFVFGANGAAVAMCRAVMETMLTRHYEAQGADLEAKIKFVLLRYSDMLAPLDLQEYRELANRVLHRGKGASEDDVIGFLRVIKRLIEEAPPRKQ